MAQSSEPLEGWKLAPLATNFDPLHSGEINFCDTSHVNKHTANRNTSIKELPALATSYFSDLELQFHIPES